MFERFERPVKIVCAAMAALVVWQLGSLILGGDPLAHLKIPGLPSLPGATNEEPKLSSKETNAAVMTNTGINGTNVAIGANGATKSTNALAAGGTAQTNASSGPGRGGLQNSGPPGGMPGMMARMMGGGMPGGMKKIELPPEVQVRVDKIIDSELLGPVVRPMPMALIGIADQEAFIQATNGQTGPVKVGGEIGGIKLLRIGVNRVLVEQGGEKKELTLFDGLGGASLMPATTSAASTNIASTNSPATHAPAKRASIRNTAANAASTNLTLSTKQKEIP
jgi:hypothetical protein